MEECPRCHKREDLCFCDVLRPRDNRIHVLILQHPQEPDKDLGTARLTNIILRQSTLKTGLSAPNLSSLVGFETRPSEWLVLFLGSKYKFRELEARQEKSELYCFDKNGRDLDVDPAGIRGIVALDGTWAQAKSLWWRNPWLLKLTRAALSPRQASLYGRLRREPRPECLSTIESIAYTLEVLGENPETVGELLSSFRRLLQKYRDSQRGKEATQPGKRSREA